MTEDARKEYVERMSTCPPFRRFGINPEWFPGTGDIEGFCHDEVVRQYHDTRIREDGGVRIEWMQAAWDYARRSSTRLPTMTDVQSIGVLIEPKVNRSTGFREENVYIGSGTGAPPRLVGPMMSALMTKVADVRPVQGRRGAHPSEYRSLWRWNLLSDATILDQFAEFLTGVETADDWYLAFEAIHPWGDGNGRSGKTLHNWLMGTLDDPVLVADYFLGGNP